MPVSIRGTRRRLWTCVVAWATFLFVVLLPAVALAGPPFETDDPEPPEYRHYEVYLVTQYDQEVGQRVETLPRVEINYGLMPNVQLSFATEHSWAGGLEGSARFGTSEAGLKMRFLQETNSRPQLAFYPSIVWSGESSQDTGARVFFPLWAQKSWGRSTIYGGGGRWHNPGPLNRDFWFTGAAMLQQLSDNLTLGAELFHSTADTVGGGGSTGFNIGGIRALGEGHSVLFSAGRSSTARSLSVYLAYGISLGPKKSFR
jgi:hypothetical protein